MFGILLLLLLCLLCILTFLILSLVTLFVKSAVILLPWTATSTILAALAALQLGKWLGRTSRERAAVGVVGTLALAFAFGYLGYWLIPPVAPPATKGLAALADPEPTAEDLWGIFPIHLAIWGAVGTTIVGGLCYQYGRGSGQEFLRKKVGA